MEATPAVTVRRRLKDANIDVDILKPLDELSEVKAA